MFLQASGWHRVGLSNLVSKHAGCDGIYLGCDSFVSHILYIHEQDDPMFNFYLFKLLCTVPLSCCNADGAQAPVFSALPRLPTLLGQFWHTLPLFRYALLPVSSSFA